jgi:hypothetical protein
VHNTHPGCLPAGTIIGAIQPSHQLSVGETTLTPQSSLPPASVQQIALPQVIDTWG